MNYPRIGSKRRIHRGACMKCNYAPRAPQFASLPERPLYRIDIQVNEMRGDDSVLKVCEACFIPDASQLLLKARAAA